MEGVLGGRGHGGGRISSSPDSRIEACRGEGVEVVGVEGWGASSVQHAVEQDCRTLKNKQQIQAACRHPAGGGEEFVTPHPF